MATNFSGVMIGLFLQPSDAAQLALPGGERAEDLHITLVYLGDKADLPESVLDKLSLVTELFSEQTPPLSGQISGVGRFTSVPEGEKTPLYASIDSLELAAWQNHLVNLLEEKGRILICPTHGFTPHITLDYLDSKQPTPSIVPPSLDLRFDAVTLAIGNARQAFVLRG